MSYCGELWGLQGWNTTRCKIGCGPRRVHLNSQKHSKVWTGRVTRLRVACVLKV